VATGVVAAGALAGGGGTAAAGIGRLTVAKNLDCKVEGVDADHAEPIDFEYHPFGIPLGSSANKYFVGAIVVNPLLVLLFLLFAYAGVVVQLFGCCCAPRRCYHPTSYRQSEANMRAPGVCWLPTLFLMQGTSLSATKMTFYPHDAPGLFVVGLFFLLACTLCPVALWKYMLCPKRFKATTTPDPRLDERANAEQWSVPGKDRQNLLTGWMRILYKFAFGERIWVSVEDAPYFVERFGMVFEQYKEGEQWFAVTELVAMLCLSALAAWQPRRGWECHTRNAIICCSLLAFLVLICVRRPWQSPLDNVVGVSLAGMLFVAVVCTTAAIALGSAATLFNLAGYLLLGAAQLLMIKGVYDVVLYLIDLKIERRSRANAARRTEAALLSTCETLTDSVTVQIPTGGRDVLYSEPSSPSLDNPASPSLRELQQGLIRVGLTPVGENERAFLQELRTELQGLEGRVVAPGADPVRTCHSPRKDWRRSRSEGSASDMMVSLRPTVVDFDSPRAEERRDHLVPLSPISPSNRTGAGFHTVERTRTLGPGNLRVSHTRPVHPKVSPMRQRRTARDVQGANGRGVGLGTSVKDKDTLRRATTSRNFTAPGGSISGENERYVV